MELKKKFFRFIRNPKHYIELISKGKINIWQIIISRVAPYSLIDDKLFIKQRFKRVFGYELNLKNPRTFNEKIQWLKLYYRNPLYTELADKYAVRSYVSEKIGSDYLVKLFAVYDDPNQIEWQSLPNKFVVKTTHSCGFNIICKDKNDLDIEGATKKLQKWIEFDYYKETNSREWHVKNIDPKIIIEEYLQGDKDFGLLDYKFFCYWGIPVFIEVHFDRFTNHTKKIFDSSWNELPYCHGFKMYDGNIEKPVKLGEMLDVSRRLSENTPFCRVDLYNFNDRVFFGELTLTPGGGFNKFDSYETDLLFGKNLKLPERYRKPKEILII